MAPVSLFIATRPVYRVRVRVRVRVRGRVSVRVRGRVRVRAHRMSTRELQATSDR